MGATTRQARRCRRGRPGIRAAPARAAREGVAVHAGHGNRGGVLAAELLVGEPLLGPRGHLHVACDSLDRAGGVCLDQRLGLVDGERLSGGAERWSPRRWRWQSPPPLRQPAPRDVPSASLQNRVYPGRGEEADGAAARRGALSRAPGGNCHNESLPTDASRRAPPSASHRHGIGGLLRLPGVAVHDRVARWRQRLPGGDGVVPRRAQRHGPRPVRRREHAAVAVHQPSAGARVRHTCSATRRPARRRAARQ